MENKNQNQTPTPSPAVVKRLPRYYRYLRELIKQGKMRISSGELSAMMRGHSTRTEISGYIRRLRERRKNCSLFVEKRLTLLREFCYNLSR